MNLNELETAILDQARGEMACPAERKPELLERINERISVGTYPPLDDVGLPIAPHGELGRVAAKWALARPVLGLFLGALAGGALGYFVGLSRGESHQVPRRAPAEAPMLTPAPSLPPPAAPESESTEEPELLVDQPQQRPGASAGVAGVPAAARRSEPPEEQALYRELTYLKQAQSALGQNKPAMAYGLMTSLDESHPRGALLVERSVTKVLALCALDRRTEARELFETLRSTAGGAPYLERLKSSCVAVSEDEQTDPAAVRHQ